MEDNNRPAKKGKRKQQQQPPLNYLPVGEVPAGTVLGYPQDQDSKPQYYKNEYGGRLPIGSMKQKKKEKKKRTLLYVTRFMFLGGAIGLIIISILRFTAVNTPTIHEAIINLYYFFFGLIIILSQLSVHKVVDNFRFLNYYWGKCLFSFFLASMSFSNKTESFVRWVLSVYFFACAFCFIALAHYDKVKDAEQAIIDQQLKAALDNERDDEEYWVEQEKIPFVNRLWQKDHRLAQYERQADEETSEEQQSLKSETQQKPGEYGIIDGEAVIEAGMTLEEQNRKKREQRKAKEALNSSF